MAIAINAPHRVEPPLERFLRRSIDIAGACAGLLLASPLLAGAAVAIKLEDGGPVLYRRLIMGRGGRLFHALKLRTMRPDADAWLDANPEVKREFERNVKLDRDPRVTRIGRLLRRTSLDELPQLANVLVGQMSLVGPRMIHPSEASRYGEFLPQRLSVRPGVTGLWQVSGRQTLNYEARIALDREYINRRSISTDTRILLHTIPTVIRCVGAR